MTLPDTASASITAPLDHLRVMVVDDSIVIRGLITRVLKEDASIHIVASVSNGEKAVERVKEGDIDVVVLDIEMPVMDGLTALPKMLDVQPDLVVIMASTLTTRNAGVSLQALEAGAMDYIPKPTTNKDLFSAEDFRRELLRKVKSLGGAAKRKRSRTGGAVHKPASAQAPSGVALASTPTQLRPASAVTPRVVAIASSTGGPVALQKVLAQIGSNFSVPIVITQHMPATFTELLAANLSRETGIVCREAKNGDPLIPGQVLIAPGDYHMLFEKQGSEVRVALSQGEPENFCRPAADPMLRSLTEIFKSSVLCVVLTGMGSDGRNGCESIVKAAGTVIAQDELTSVVWGMPGAVSRANLCHAVLPLEQIGQKINSMVRC